MSKGFSYLATDYDFSFDVNSGEKIVCSEMPYQCFIGIPFRVDEVMGSWTIGPDDVAVAAGSDDSRPFELIYFVHNGKRVDEKEMMKKYISILNSEGSKYEQFPKYERTRTDDMYLW